MNKPERECADALEVLEVKYEYQYRFNNCRDKRTLPFDFYLTGLNAVIEYDGIFHVKDIYGTLADVQRRDAIKNKYCGDNDIKMLRIPYTERANISQLITEFIDGLTS